MKKNNTLPEPKELIKYLVDFATIIMNTGDQTVIGKLKEAIAEMPPKLGTEIKEEFENREKRERCDLSHQIIPRKLE